MSGFLSYEGCRGTMPSPEGSKRTLKYLRENNLMNEEQLAYLEKRFREVVHEVEPEEQIILCRPFTKFLRWLPLSAAKSGNAIMLIAIIVLGFMALINVAKGVF